LKILSLFAKYSRLKINFINENLIPVFVGWNLAIGLIKTEESPPTINGYSQKRGLERDGNGSETKPPVEWNDVANQ